MTGASWRDPAPLSNSEGRCPPSFTVVRPGVSSGVPMLIALLLLAQTAPAAAPAAGWMEQFDALWMKRDQPGAEKQLGLILKEQLSSDANSFEANWRLAELLNWQANAATGDFKAGLGKAAWQAGDKAIL